MRALVAVVFLGLLLGAPSALAQGLPVQACGPLTLNAAPPTATPPGGAASFVVSVQNTGQRPANIVVAASTPTTGWRIVGEDSLTATVANGASTDLTFQVQADASATQDAAINLSLSGECPPAPGVACPGAACTATPQNASVTAVLQRDAGPVDIPIIGRLGIPAEYLFAGLVLVGLAAALPLVLRKRRPAGPKADCPEPVKSLSPGRGASFPVEIRNPAEAAMTAQFEIGPVPEGWSAFLPLPEVQLGAKESRSLWLMVRAPETAREGEAVEVDLQVRDAAHPERPVAIRVRAEVRAQAA